jgi:Fur family ferric uptake transcriptional regulator
MAIAVETIDEVKKIFSAYLEQKAQRKTVERFQILEEIYSRHDHFDAEVLYIDLKHKGLNVSRATVYNTLDLLISCDLIKKHQFGKNLAQFEKAYKFKQHDHLICSDCEKVFEFCDPRIMQIQKMAEDMLNFDVFHHSLNFFAKCRSLKENGVCEHKKPTVK